MYIYVFFKFIHTYTADSLPSFRCRLINHLHNNKNLIIT